MAGDGSSKGTTDGKYNWIQSHDIDADMIPNGIETFTQIGSLYDKNGNVSTPNALAYIAYFTGNYDGNTQHQYGNGTVWKHHRSSGKKCYPLFR